VTFTVVWKPTAIAELANIWLNAPDRAGVTAAAHQIDTALRTDPFAVGESRSGRRRILFVPPLGVDYEIHELDRRVNVLRVWTWPRTEFTPPGSSV
jgi:hypothetical protein